MRLRVGHAPLVKIYAKLLDPSSGPLDPLCNEEPQTIDQCLWRCSRLNATRQNTFGSHSPPLKVFTTKPERVLTLASNKNTKVSRLQPFRGDPNNPYEGANAIAQARKPQARPSGETKEKNFHCGFFT